MTPIDPPSDGGCYHGMSPDGYAHAHLEQCIEIGAMTVLVPALEDDEGVVDHETWETLTAEETDRLTASEPLTRVSAILDLADEAYNKLPDAEPWSGVPDGER